MVLQFTPSSLSSSLLVGKKTVNVLIRYFCERRVAQGSGFLFRTDFLDNFFKDFRELQRSFLYSQSHQSQRGSGVENYDEDHTLGNDRDVYIVSLSLMKQD